MMTTSGWRWVLLLCFLSAVAMPIFEIEASNGEQDRPALLFLGPDLVGWLSSDTVLPVMLALGLSTAFLHYLMDRAIWRFSDPQVRKSAAALLE